MSEYLPHDNPMLAVENAERRFGDLTVFSGVTFSLDAGQCCAIVGANGAGKSTLLRCVIGADNLDHGAITVDGTVADEASPRFRVAVAAVVGDAATFAHLTAHEHLQLIATAHGMPEAHALASRTVSEVGLADSADQLPSTLSSGQRRRLALASTLVRPRRLLVLDEPEQHLDQAGHRWISAHIRAEKAAGRAVLLASHDAALVDAVADLTVDADAWR